MEVFLVLIGWALGILSTIIVDYWRQYLRKKKFVSAVNTELSELQPRLLYTVYRIAEKYGGFDRTFLDWFLPLATKYESWEDYRQINQDIAALSDMDEAKLEIWLERRRESGLSDIALKKFTLSYVSSRTPDFELLPIDSARRVFDIITRLDLINQNVDEVRQCFLMTFDSSLSPENYKAVNNNRKAGYEMVRDAARVLITRIDEFLSN